MTRTKSSWITASLIALLLATLAIPLALPAQAYAEPDTSKVYTVGDATYRPIKESGSWSAIVMGCKGSSSVTVAENVKIDGVSMPVSNIFPGAFMHKDSLKTLTINAKIGYVPHTMCSNCPKLEKVILPNTVTEIDEQAFLNCTSLKSISDLLNVERIGKNAFENCKSLRSIRTNKLTTIGKEAFRGCSVLENIADPASGNANKGLKNIHSYAFYECMSLTYIGLLDNVRTLGDYAFYKCHSFPSMEFVDLTSIGEGTFQNCTSLVSISLGSTETIGTKAFENCVSLKNLTFSGEEQRIEASAFKGCASLGSVVLPSSLEFLGVAAFMNCTNMTRFVIPSPGNMTYVPSNVCKGCKALKSVRIPLSISDNVGSDAFENSGLETVYVLNKDTEFNGNPFKGISGLTMIGWSVSKAREFADAHDEIGWISLEDPNSSLKKVEIKFSKGYESATGTMANAWVPFGGDYTLPECEFTWAGHVFAGWEHWGSVYQPGEVFENAASDEIGFVAQWDVVSTVTLMGPSGSIVKNYERGSSYTVPKNPFNNSGKIFAGWHDADSAGTTYSPGDVISSLPGSLTLVADWVTQAEVTFDPAGGTFSDGTTDPKTAFTNRYGTLYSFPEIEKDGWEFGGWQLVYIPPADPSHPVVMIVNSDESFVEYSTMQAGERIVKLRALWKNNPPHDVILDPNGGTVNGSEDLIWLTTDNTGFLTDNTICAYTPARKHYTFAGWVFSGGDKIMPGFYHYYNADTIVAASWEPIKVAKVTLSPSSASLVKGETLELKAAVTPADALDTSVKWSSSNAAVASVDAAGKVTALAAGTAVITCASSDGGAKAACTVTVSAGTAISEGSTASAADAFLTSYNKEADPAGAVFGKLRLKASKVGKSSVTLAWKKVAGAKKYVVYGAQCGKKKLAKVASLGGGKAKYAWKKLSGKKLAKGTYYKAVVVALGAGDKVLSTSKMVHAATKGGKVGNHVKVSTKAKKGKAALKAGKTFKLAGKAASGKKKVKLHRKPAVAYESSNEAVATVSKKGQIKAKGAGTCEVYAFAQNGVFARVKVTVKGGTTVSTQAVEATDDIDDAVDDPSAAPLHASTID